MSFDVQHNGKERDTFLERNGVALVPNARDLRVSKGGYGIIFVGK